MHAQGLRYLLCYNVVTQTTDACFHTLAYLYVLQAKADNNIIITKFHGKTIIVCASSFGATWTNSFLHGRINIFCLTESAIWQRTGERL